MLYFESRSDDLPVADRLPWWRERTRQSIVPTVISCDNYTNFHAKTRAVSLGGVSVSELTYRSMAYYRSAKMVRQSDPEQLQLAVNLRGRLGISVNGQESLLGERDLVLYDTSRPFSGFTSDDGHAAVQIMVQVPRALVHLPSNAVDRIVGVDLPGRGGIAALCSTYFVGLLENARQYQPSDAARLSIVTLDLLTALVAHYVDAATPPDTRQRILQIRVHDFIQRRLDDPELTPRAIAAAHGISTRYLHKMFHQQGLSVAGWIRHRRLERCRRDLTDPRQRDRPIYSIASQWGFTDSAHFSRLFRRTYGMTPSDYRHCAQPSDD